jgi:3-oxoacyl-[acyl-carrier protein] reductase
MTSPLAFITGLGRPNGIAHAIALRLASEGWDIAFSHWPSYDARLGLGASSAQEISEEIRATGRKVLGLEADLADPDTPERLLAETNATLGPVSALVLSHSEGVDSTILDTTVESFDRHFAVNVRAAWLLIAAFARQIGSGGGAVVALTSDHVVGNLPYGASKGALDRIVIAAARELGPLGIRGNVLNPGPIDTGWMTDDVREFLTARQPTGRLGRPTDTADVVSFLVSPKGAWISGQLITSDGGFSV